VAESVRRGGLKPLWSLRPCGFESHPGHPVRREKVQVTAIHVCVEDHEVSAVVTRWSQSFGRRPGQKAPDRHGRRYTHFVRFVHFVRTSTVSSAMSESEQAHAAATALPGGRVVVLPSGPDQQPIEVPASVVEVLADVLDHLQRGEHVRVIADDEEITTQQAADLINVSRPYLVGLVDRGEIPSRKVGARRRLKLADVLLYREVDQARRLRAVADLAAEAQDLGLY
jgi:excisionase family DNA binding protein